MRANPVAENVLGTMGTICWTGQLIPQVWKNYRDKKTAGLSPWLMLIWGLSSAPLGVYSVIQRLNIPLQIQPQLFGFLALMSWGQCLYYDPRRSGKRLQSVLITVFVMVLTGMIELALILGTRPVHDRGNEVPTQVFGILSAVFISGGLLPQYWEIYKLREVKGISYTFLSIDTLGGILNDLSLAFAAHFDVLAGVSYSLVAVMDSAILVAALILNPRARKRRRRLLESEAANPDMESISATAVSSDANPNLHTQHHATNEENRTHEIEVGNTNLALSGTEKQPNSEHHTIPMRQVDSESPTVVGIACVDMDEGDEKRDTEMCFRTLRHSFVPSSPRTPSSIASIEKCGLKRGNEYDGDVVTGRAERADDWEKNGGTS